MRVRQTIGTIGVLSGALLLASLPVLAEGPRVIYTKSFPGSLPPFESIAVERDGSAVYNETEDPDNDEKFRIESAAVERIFEIAEKLQHFKTPVESGLKVANMGRKTFLWEDGATKTQSTFNFSQNEEARALTDIMESAGDSVRMLIELRRVMRHDRLGVHASILKIQAAWDNKRLLGTADFLPILDQVANNEALIHMARERAAQVADGIRSTSNGKK
ncbi:MAG: hypothetical protein ABL995_03070 [Bryobacteraceae bacterium]